MARGGARGHEGGLRGASPGAAPAEAPLKISARLGHPLRVGGIDYLNSRPLLEALPSLLGPEAEISNSVPSELARKLRSGSLDIALVPVAEYFEKASDYWIIPGISISSYGPVESIRIFHRRPLRAVARVGLDRSSMTSSLLTRLLFAEEWAAGKTGPRFETIPPEEALLALTAAEPRFDAILLIGDSSLSVEPCSRWEVADLGTVWTRLTGLPFVYAFWAYRGPPLPGLVGAFRRSRDLGRDRIDQIVESGPLPSGMSPERARRYLFQVIRHDLGPAEIEGLLEFHRRALSMGLLEAAGPPVLRFLEDGDEGS